MGQRNMLCASQMIDLEMDRQGQGYLHPEPCILLGGITSFPQPEMQTMVPAPGNTTNIEPHHVAERYDSALFYGMPQYHHGIPHHPPHHAPNLDLNVATASNFYVPYMAPSSGLPLNHGSCDHLSSSSSYGVIGVPPDEYGTNNHFMDNARGSYKRKNAEVSPGNFQCFNASASSSSSVTPLNTRHPDGVSLMDTASATFTPHYRGNNAPSIREVGSHRSVRNRLGATGLDPGLGHNQNNFIQGNYMGQPFQPAGALWLDQQLANNSSDAGASWTQNSTVTYMHGSSVSGGSVETGNMGPQRYPELSTNRSTTSFLHPSHGNLRHHNFHHLSPPIQGMRGHNLNVISQLPHALFRGPTSYGSQNNINPSQDGLGEIGVRHPGSAPPGLRMYRPHREGVMAETTLRHRNLPLRVLPTDGVAVIEFPEYYEVENHVDHHSDMRLDIEDMSYEELLALGERIGNVNTGLSEEVIRNRLKTRTYKSSKMMINLEETACMDQEPDSCIICQDDYKSEEKIGMLGCGHEYHADCLMKWLRLKNVCPICKSEALPGEGK